MWDIQGFCLLGAELTGLVTNEVADNEVSLLRVIVFHGSG